MVLIADNSILFQGRPTTFPTHPIIKIVKGGIRVVRKRDIAPITIIEMEAFVDQQER